MDKDENREKEERTKKQMKISPRREQMKKGVTRGRQKVNEGSIQTLNK